MRGRLALTVLLACSLSLADDSPKTVSCGSALGACLSLVKERAEQAEHLKAAVKQLEGQLAKSEPPSGLQLVPWPVWILLGGVVSVGIGKGLGK